MFQFVSWNHTIFVSDLQPKLGGNERNKNGLNEDQQGKKMTSYSETKLVLHPKLLVSVQRKLGKNLFCYFAKQPKLTFFQIV
jgi:hypothetical protein